MIRNKIFKNLLLVAIVSILTMTLLVSLIMYDQYEKSLKNSLRNEAVLIADGINLAGIAFLDAMTNIPDALRLTLVEPDGTVVFDNRSDPEKMENHILRKEIASALQVGAGEDERLSETLDIKSYYYAQRLDDDRIIRVAKAAKSIWAIFVANLLYLLLILFLAAVIAYGLAKRQTGKIVSPLNNLNLDHPMVNEIYDELAPLVTRISNQQNQIKLHLEEIQEKQAEFNSVVNNMREGLIILNQNGNILTINQRVQKIFNAEPGNYIGKKIYVLHRSSALQKSIEKAIHGVANEEIITIDGSHYQMLANPVYAESQLRGIILLILDVTEKQESEQRRREFTANVSHELKTPLTTIRGYAEIISNGLAKPEDTPEFAGRIYREADRMLAMVNDIMTLSHLDESLPSPKFEKLDLAEILSDVIERMRPLAARKKLSIEYQGTPMVIFGIRVLLDEMFFNIFDNAIKYNHPEGKIRVNLVADDDFVTVRIADTGIGIAREDQPRIFERFYRVDKSHSRDSGGTGLGLSIVKHCALVHQAKVDLFSEVKVGTTVSVVFPRKNLEMNELSADI